MGEWGKERGAVGSLVGWGVVSFKREKKGNGVLKKKKLEKEKKKADGGMRAHDR
jgi:hypothetical protein